MFNKVLIANRGEIALRILRACKQMGIKTVAVHSVADANLMHVRLADESVCIGPNQSSGSYLNIASILSAAELTGADAIHPGVGFLSENARFAEIVQEHGIKFIGPDVEHLISMGDKIIAKTTMAKMGVPVVIGSDGSLESVDQARETAERSGYPVLFKAVNGGGGKGMKVANCEADLEQAYNMAKAEAKANFGNDAVYMERYLAQPRHIEFQIIADSYGNVVHLGERDCSIQRNHQKLIEESPCMIIDNPTRDKITHTIVEAVRSIGYVGVGTLEFLYENGQFFFMEMNTRLQVEHSVSEELTGIDIVREQIRIAAGNKLSFRQEDVRFSGHVMEFRINAENPQSFMPSPGRITELHFPAGIDVRVDSHVYDGYVVPPYYDSLVAKIVVKGSDRNECISRGRAALDELIIDGIQNTAPLHRQILDDPDFINGDFNIHWLKRWIDRRTDHSVL